MEDTFSSSFSSDSLGDTSIYQSLTGDADAAQVLQILDSSSTETEAVHRLAGRTASSFHASAPSDSKKLKAFKRINKAMAQLQGSMERYNYSQASPQQKAALKRLNAQLGFKDSAMSKAVGLAAKSMKATKKSDPKDVEKKIRQFVVANQLHELKSILQQMEQTTAQMAMSAPGLAEKKNGWQAALLASQMNSVPFSTRAKVTPKNISEGGVSGAYQLRGVCNLQGSGPLGDSVAIERTEPDTVVTEPIAVIKPGHQEAGGVHTIRTEAELNQVPLASYGQQPGWGPVNERTAYFLQQELGIPLGVPETEACLLNHPSFGEPDKDLKALKVEYGLDFSSEEILEIAAKIDQKHLDSFLFAAKKMAFNKVAAEMKSLNLGQSFLPESLNGAMIQACLERAGSEQEFVRILGEATNIPKETLQSALFGLSIGTVTLPPAKPGLTHLIQENLGVSTSKDQVSRPSTKMEAHLRNLYTKITQSTPTNSPHWCSMQAWVEGGVLLGDLSPEERLEVAPLGFARLAILDGITGNKDRSANNIMTVTRTREDLLSSVETQLPGFADYISNALQKITVPSHLIEESVVKLVEQEAEKLLDEWDKSHPQQLIDNSRLAIEWETHTLLYMLISAKDSFRDVVAIDNALGMPDPDEGIGDWRNFGNPSNNFWIGEPGARRAKIPSRTRKYLATLDTEQVMEHLRGEHRRLQNAAGPEHVNLTNVSEGRYQLLHLHMLSLKTAAKLGKTAFEIALVKDNLAIQDADSNFISPGGQITTIYTNKVENEKFDEKLLSSEIAHAFNEISAHVGTPLDGFSKIHSDQTRLATHG